MPRLSLLPLMAVSFVALAACSAPHSGSDVSRQAQALFLTADAAAKQESDLARQADILNARTAEILRKSTLRGAGIGAAAGCGIGIATGTGAGNCLGGAVAGGAIGALAGRAHGQAQIEKRIEIVNPQPLVSGISKAGTAMSHLSRDLPGLMVAQDAELAQMRRAVASGRLDHASYTKRQAEIATSRQRLAAALELSAKQAAEASAALLAAEAEGQTGLAWHKHQVSRLEKDAMSARSAVTLL